MVVAKSDAAYTALKHAFKVEGREDSDHAVAQGILTDGGHHRCADRAHPVSDDQFAVVEGGRPSVTHYEVSMFLAVSRGSSP